MNQELNFNFFNILIIAASIQGILFGGVILFSKKYKLTANYYLAQVIIYLSLNNLYYWFFDTKIATSFELLKFIYVPFNFLVLPMYYFFVKSYLKLSLTKKEKNIFLLPFKISLGIHFCILLNQIFLKNKFKIPNSFLNLFYYAEEYFSILFTLFIIYRSYKEIKKVKKYQDSFTSLNVPIKTKWLKSLLNYGLFVCFLWLIVVLTNQYFNISLFKNNEKYFLWLTMSALVYWLGYSGIHYTGIFNQRQVIRENLVLKNDNKPQKKLSKSKFEEIDLIIKNEKLYLNPQLSLELLAKKLNLSTGYLSKLFNEFTESNFSTYINKFRIQEAVKILKNEEYKNYTILAIALEVGFNSKSTFYNAFKKEMGCTPTQYQQNNVS